MKTLLFILIFAASSLFGQSSQDSLYVPVGYDFFKSRPHETMIKEYIVDNIGNKIGNGTSYDFIYPILAMQDSTGSSKIEITETMYLDLRPGDFITLSKGDSVYYYLIVYKSTGAGDIWYATQDMFLHKGLESNLRILSFWDIYYSRKYKKLRKKYYMVR